MNAHLKTQILKFGTPVLGSCQLIESDVKTELKQPRTNGREEAQQLADIVSIT